MKPLTTLLTLICVATRTYGGGQFRATVAYPYLIFVDNASQVWALYCLVLVYMNTHRVLAGASPALKFLCVKGVVFATFWQGVLLSLLTYCGAISSLHETWSTSCVMGQEAVVDALQDFLITVEMLLFALLHAAAFPSREYRDANLPRRAAGAVELRGKLLAEMAGGELLRRHLAPCRHLGAEMAGGGMPRCLQRLQDRRRIAAERLHQGAAVGEGAAPPHRAPGCLGPAGAGRALAQPPARIR